MGVRNLQQKVRIRAEPHDVFEALVDPREQAKFTGAAAKLERRPGGRFSHWDGSLTGFVLDLEKDRRIVLAWRSEGWPEGHYSIARFDLTRSRGGTQLTFSQYGIPTEEFDDISDGWKQYYWQPLQAYFEE